MRRSNVSHIENKYNDPLHTRIAQLAQSVEHQAFNLRVAGSSPSLGGVCFCNLFVLFFRHLSLFELMKSFPEDLTRFQMEYLKMVSFLVCY